MTSLSPAQHTVLKIAADRRYNFATLNRLLTETSYSETEVRSAAKRLVTKKFLLDLKVFTAWQVRTKGRLYLMDVEERRTTAARRKQTHFACQE